MQVLHFFLEKFLKYHAPFYHLSPVIYQHSKIVQFFGPSTTFMYSAHVTFRNNYNNLFFNTSKFWYQESSLNQHLIALVSLCEILRTEYLLSSTVEATTRQYSNETTTSVIKFCVIKHYNMNKLLTSDIVVRSYNKCSN